MVPSSPQLQFATDFRLRGLAEKGRTCCWLDPVANGAELHGCISVLPTLIFSIIPANDNVAEYVAIPNLFN
jgi:hypothetical protein